MLFSRFSFFYTDTRSAILDFCGGFRWLRVLSLCIRRRQCSIQLSILRSDASCLRNACLFEKTYTKIKRKIKKIKKTGQTLLKPEWNWSAYFSFQKCGLSQWHGSKFIHTVQPAFEGRGQLTKEI